MNHVDLRTIDQRALKLALKRVIEKTFDEDKWQELGFVTGTLGKITGHPRLLKSLYFGDDDYSRSVVSVLEIIIEADSNNLNIIADFIDLEGWLEENYPTLHMKWFPSSIQTGINEEVSSSDIKTLSGSRQSALRVYPPTEIKDSLRKFREDHPDTARVAFIMMQFGGTPAHSRIVEAIRRTLTDRGITALRADDKQYHDDLLPNIITYIYGCNFGIAVFERLEAEQFNPNVSLEVGYMLALGKPVCLLKDRPLRTLHADLIGKLYKSFDPQNPTTSIPTELQKWLNDKDLS